MNRHVPQLGHTTFCFSIPNQEKLEDSKRRIQTHVFALTRQCCEPAYHKYRCQFYIRQFDMTGSSTQSTALRCIPTVGLMCRCKSNFPPVSRFFLFRSPLCVSEVQIRIQSTDYIDILKSICAVILTVQ